MSSTQLAPTLPRTRRAVAAVPTRFEVTRLPVTDFDRAKAFYQRLGWRLDIEFKPDGEHRVLQFTPPASTASIQFAEGGEAGTPLEGMILVVDDIDVARDELIGRGAEVSEVWHLEIGKGKVPARTRSGGRTPAGRRSAIPTGTAGSCRRSPSGCRDAWV